MAESTGTRPGWVTWSGLAIPVILACAIGWEMQQDMGLWLVPFVLILLLALPVGYFFALRATRPQGRDDEDRTSPLT